MSPATGRTTCWPGSKTTPGQEFDYLTDVTAVDYRDPERPLEVVYQLRSLARKADLRVKVALDKRAPLEVRFGLRSLAAAPTGWSARCTTCSA